MNKYIIIVRYLLLFLLVSCKIEETEPYVQETPVVVQEETISQELVLEGTYKRQIGSQYEVYEIGDKLSVYIQTADSYNKIFESDYSYTETDIIIDGNLYPYELFTDRIVICGYIYYRELI